MDFTNFPFEKDEWEAWREHPLTDWLFDVFLARAAEDAKQEFINYAWDKGNNDPAFHASCFERAKLINELRLLEYDDLI
jgi:hypothetical protein